MCDSNPRDRRAWTFHVRAVLSSWASAINSQAQSTKKNTGAVIESCIGEPSANRWVLLCRWSIEEKRCHICSHRACIVVTFEQEIQNGPLELNYKCLCCPMILQATVLLLNEVRPSPLPSCFQHVAPCQSPYQPAWLRTEGNASRLDHVFHHVSTAGGSRRLHR